MTVEELKIILKINGATTYTHQINEVTNVTNNYTKSIGSLTSAIAKLVSAGLVAKLAKQCVQAASDLEEVANVTNVTFGKSAEVIDKWAKNQAANFGLSETAAKRYIGTYGTMAKQFGMTTTQAATMGVELTKLTGDVASFYNLTDSAAAVKLKAVFTGETESLKELGVVMTETQLNAYAMSKGLGKTVKDMTEQEKVLLRYQFTMDKLSHAQGDFQRTSDGYANSTRLLTLNLENLKVEIGKELLPVAVQGIQAVNNIVNVVGPSVVKVAQYVRYYAEAWKNASEVTKTYTGFAVAAVAAMIVVPKVIGLIGKAIDILTVKTLTFKTVLQGLFGLLSILFAAAAIKNLSEQVDAIKAQEAADGLNNLGESSEVSAGAVDDLADSLNNLDNSAKGLENFLASFDEVNKVGGNESLMSGIVNGDDLANILAASSGLNDINSIIDDIGRSINDVTQDQIFSAAWWDEKKKFFGGYWDYLVQSFKDGSFKDDFIAALEEIGGWFEENFPEWFNFWEKLGEKIYDAVNTAKTIADVSVKVGTAVVKSETGVDLSDKTSLLTSAFKLLGKIPKFGAGGEPNRGSLFIAGETGPELVGNFGGSRTKVVNQSQTGGSSEPAPIYFQPTIQIDGRKLTAIVMDYANGMTRSASGSPIISLGG